MTRENRARPSSIAVASGSPHQSSRCDIVPQTKIRSRGPWPNTWKAIETPSFSA